MHHRVRKHSLLSIVGGLETHSDLLCFGALSITSFFSKKATNTPYRLSHKCTAQELFGSIKFCPVCGWKSKYLTFCSSRTPSIWEKHSWRKRSLLGTLIIILSRMNNLLQILGIHCKQFDARLMILKLFRKRKREICKVYCTVIESSSSWRDVARFLKKNWSKLSFFFVL